MILTLEDWKKHTLANYIKKHAPLKEEVKHVLDYLKAHPNERLARASYPQVLIKANQWTERVNKKNKNLKSSGKVKVLKTFSNGFKFVHLLDQTAKNWEGLHMEHCVATYSDSKSIYSLRDAENYPHATFEIKGQKIFQSVGKRNSFISEKYLPMVLSIFKNHSCYENLLKDLCLVPVGKKLKAFIEEHFNEPKFIFSFEKKAFLYLPHKSHLVLKKVIIDCSSEAANFLIANYDSDSKDEMILKFVKNKKIKISEDNLEEVERSLTYGLNFVELTYRQKNFFKKYFKSLKFLSVGKKCYLEPQSLNLVKSFRSKNFENFVLVCSVLPSIEAVNLFIKSGVKIDDQTGQALRLAVKYNNLEIIKILLTAGADPAIMDHNAVKNAAYWGNLEIIKEFTPLVNWTEDVKSDILSYAATNKQKEVFNFLLKQGNLSDEVNLNAKEFYRTHALNGVWNKA